MSTDSVISALSSTLSTDTSTETTTLASTGLDQDAFLQLLLTEIEYQDPLSPMDSTEFVSQLAELSQLEQLTSIQAGMEDVVEAMEDVTSASSITYLGKDVVAEGDDIALADGAASQVTYTLDEDAEAVYLNILDSDGDIIDSTLVGSQEAGDYDYTWDGKDYNGETMEDGTYSIYVYALNADGDSIDTSTQVAGTVTGVEQTSSGVVLTLDDGRSVYLADVTSVVSG